ncbi:phosphotransferase [Cohnella cellulosilytica]|uniref:Phosphotransferase n=1 Tax=Cohnella cellulosilytica TaxID=986710 RepID=A0ABW2F7M4_9BACL
MEQRLQAGRRLLRVLSERGIAVPEALGWGLDPNGDQALLTAYGGESVAKANAGTMSALAGILSAIHRIPVGSLKGVKLPKHDLAAYFFPGVEAYPDLEQALRRLTARIPETSDRIIHGDYHLQNIVERDGEYAILDWTNGQAGDFRYDFAWACVLIRIYASERLASAFRAAYLRANPIPPEELRLFEGIACLRWMLLHRRGGVPQGPRTVKKVREIVASLEGIVPVELLG